MAHLIGPDFVSIQVEDLDAARTFYSEVLGLPLAPGGPPGAVVFDAKPVPFAVRKPLGDLGTTDKLGWGVAIWFGCDDADALHDDLAGRGVPIVFRPKDGPVRPLLLVPRPVRLQHHRPHDPAAVRGGRVAATMAARRSYGFASAVGVSASRPRPGGPAA